jgi:threonine dehydrogenase-like Zn-dependent dehydrogenase
MPRRDGPVRAAVGSDLHMLSAGLVPAGHVLGHEITGTVAALGPGVAGWTAGGRVAVLPLVACRQCYACLAGRPNLCEEQGIDHGPGIGRPGGYAESVAVPAGMLRRLPDSVSDTHGALAEPLAVALHAIRVSAAGPPGRRRAAWRPRPRARGRTRRGAAVARRPADDGDRFDRASERRPAGAAPAGRLAG